MSKPFSIQSPENIAKEYGGNKQKIASAMQMGIVDATVGVLAGMFIDRMRSAQGQEGAPQATVAQQVMGGVQAAPPEVPSPTPGGLGATQQAAPPMAPPQMGAPEEAPMGFADGGFVGPYAAAGSGNVGPMVAPQPMQDMQGGLGGLPVPDTMFDEPDNGGYAGGGLVAFAEGGKGAMSSLYGDVEYHESRGKQSAVSPKGARGVMQLMPGTMRDPGFGIAPLKDNSEGENRRVGREYLDAMHRKYGDQKIALMAYNWGPGNVDKWLKAGAPADKVPAETRKYVSNILGGDKAPLPERDVSTAAGRFDAPMDIYRALQSEFGPTKEEQESDKARRARAEEMASPEYYEKTRKSDMWQTLAEIGFNMASSKSPYLLQAVGEAAAAAMPGAEASAKERKALKDRALDVMHEMNGAKRKENLQLFGVAVDAAKEGTRAEQFEKEYGLKERELAQQATLTREGRTSAENIARIGATSRDTTFDIAYQNNYNVLKAAADAGAWKTPSGNRPSDDTIKYIAQQHALEDINKYKTASQGQAVDLNGDGIPDTLDRQQAANTSQFKVLGTE